MCDGREENTMQEPILSVENLHVKFKLRGKTLHALRGVTLDVYRGESLAIVGESGCGKSVLNKNLSACWMAMALFPRDRSATTMPWKSSREAPPASRMSRAGCMWT